jgi:arylsulfatase A-like enzyme
MRCDLGCYGDAYVKSPNIDRLAASGVVFTRAYCQQAVCNPSRASLMTGLRPDTTKVWDLETDLRTVLPDALTIPQHFREHGYRALSYGKIFHNPFPDNVSWDQPHEWPKAATRSKEARQNLAAFKAKMRAEGKPDAAIERMRAVATEALDVADSDHFDGAIAEQGLAAMRTLAAGEQPFFLAVGFVRPHLPFVSPRKYWDLYDRQTIPLAANGSMPEGAPAVAFGDKGGGFYELRDYMDYADAPWPRTGPLTEAQQRELKHGYYAAVSYDDALIGRLLDELEHLGLAQNTIVVFWSDHGYKLGEHGGWCKQTNYEIDTRAPLIIRMPGAQANGQPCRSLVEFVDIFPTLCELAGLPLPPKLEGKSLKPLLADAGAKVHDAAFSQFPHKQDGQAYMGYAMRTDRYRYVEWLDRKTGEVAAHELYDHETDPDENQNIAADPANAALIEELSRQMWTALPRPKF